MTTTATAPDPDVSSPLWIRFGERTKQNRLTVFFRIILLIPQYIVVYLLQIVLFFAAIVAWFAALFTGKLPESLAFFMTGVVRWQARVAAYGVLLNDRYPPFSLESKPEYPVDVTVQSGKLNRLAVLFRIILVIPAAIVQTALLYGLGVFSIILWIAALILGELPESFYGAASAAIRFQVRVGAYFLMLTSYYPGKLMGDREPGAVPSPTVAAPDEAAGAPAVAAPAASPWELVLSKGARTLVVIFIVLGALAYVGGAVAISVAASNSTSALGSLGVAVDKTVTLQDLTDAYNTAGKSANTFSSSVQSCKADLTCVQTASTTFAAALTTYASKVGSLNVPVSATTQQQAAEQAARKAAAAVTSLGAATSAQAYAQIANSSTFSSALDAVDSTSTKLETAIANGS